MSKEFRIVLALIAIGIALGVVSLRFGLVVAFSVPTPEPIVWPVIQPSTPDEWASEPVQGLRLWVKEVAVIGLIEDGNLIWSADADAEFRSRTETASAVMEWNDTGRFIQLCVEIENQGVEEVSIGLTDFGIIHNGEILELSTSGGTWPFSRVHIRPESPRAGCLILKRPVRTNVAALSVTVEISPNDELLTVNDVPVPHTGTKAVGNKPVVDQAIPSQPVANEPVASDALESQASPTNVDTSNEPTLSEPILTVTEVTVIGTVDNGKFSWSSNVDGAFRTRTEQESQAWHGNETGRFVQVCAQIDNQGAETISVDSDDFTINHDGGANQIDFHASTWPFQGVDIPPKGSSVGCLVLERPISTEVTTLSITATPFILDPDIDDPILSVDDVMVPATLQE